jgi:hypothetical protein
VAFSQDLLTLCACCPMQDGGRVRPLSCSFAVNLYAEAALHGASAQGMPSDALLTAWLLECRRLERRSPQRG